MLRGGRAAQGMIHDGCTENEREFHHKGTKDTKTERKVQLFVIKGCLAKHDNAQCYNHCITADFSIE